MSEQGLAALTLEAVAVRADCSVHSLCGVFGGGDDLLHAIYERHSPLLDIEQTLAGAGHDLAATVGEIYRTPAHALTREPRIMPAVLAEVLARPTGAPSPASPPATPHAC
ncbi:hypothetical protein [Sphaerisporangium sp. NPDC051011]|uniref:hypothetical protein n=1 Tax=Sphaerisporangium sp. NPDC051011 TaxID=3155792 RepID=UPI0033C9239E